MHKNCKKCKLQGTGSRNLSMGTCTIILLKIYFDHVEQLNSPIDRKKPKSNCLYIREGELFWKGDYDSQKELIELSDFNLCGKWLSSGEESKKFINHYFVLKWQGKSKQHLTVVKVYSKATF